MEGPAGGSELDAELAFIQKKIAEGVARARKELEEQKAREVQAAAQEAVARRDRDWERRTGEAAERAAKETETAAARARAESAKEAERHLTEALARQEAQLAQKARDEQEARMEALRAQLVQTYEKRESDLKAQLGADRKAFEDDLRRASDRELARDRRDLEETYQARSAKREQEIREASDQSIKARETELRRGLEVELRQRESELRSAMDVEHRKRLTELEAEAEKRAAQQLSADRARLDSEMARKLEASQAHAEQEAHAHAQETEARLKEKYQTDLDRERTRIETDFQNRIFRRGRYAQLARRLKTPLFPFSAVVGQDKAKRALLLNAIDPALGGVVLWGPEGNAKFNLVLAFAQVLAPLQEKLVPGVEGKRPWQDEERYLTGRVHYGRETGSYLVDTVLQSAALSLPRPPVKQSSHPSGGMPPALLGGLKEEDEEAYHLLSGMTLHVEVASPATVEERLEVIRRNLEFRKNPETFRRQYTQEEEELRTNLVKARDRLHGVSLSAKVMTLVARMTLLDRQSANLDVLMEQLARANAAFESRSSVESADVMEAADLALLHRLTPRELAEIERSSPSGADPMGGTGPTRPKGI